MYRLLRAIQKFILQLFLIAGVCCLQLAIAHAEPDADKKMAKIGKSIGSIETEYPNWFHDGFLDFKEDLATANAEGKLLMIIFTQNGCPYCNALVERNLAQKDIEELVRGKFVVVAINLLGDRIVSSLEGRAYTEKTYAESLKVQFTPTILFFNERGETVLRVNGYLPPQQFKIALSYIVEKNKQLSYRDFLELNSPPMQAGKLNQESFYLSPPYKLNRKLSSSPRPLAVFFEQKDCPNCDFLHKNILADVETRNLIAQFDAVQLDMWDKTTLVTTPDGAVKTAREWARQLDVKYAPTIILFDSAGNEIIRSEALFKLFHTQTFFSYVQSEAYKQQPNFQRFISQRSELLRSQGKDVDIWGEADDSMKRN